MQAMSDMESGNVVFNGSPLTGTAADNVAAPTADQGSIPTPDGHPALESSIYPNYDQQIEQGPPVQQAPPPQAPAYQYAPPAPQVTPDQGYQFRQYAQEQYIGQLEQQLSTVQQAIRNNPALERQIVDSWHGAPPPPQQQQAPAQGAPQQQAPPQSQSDRRLFEEMAALKLETEGIKIDRKLEQMSRKYGGKFNAQATLAYAIGHNTDLDTAFYRIVGEQAVQQWGGQQQQQQYAPQAQQQQYAPQPQYAPPPQQQYAPQYQPPPGYALVPQQYAPQPHLSVVPQPSARPEVPRARQAPPPTGPAAPRPFDGFTRQTGWNSADALAAQMLGTRGA